MRHNTNSSALPVADPDFSDGGGQPVEGGDANRVQFFLKKSCGFWETIGQIIGPHKFIRDYNKVKNLIRCRVMIVDDSENFTPFLSFVKIDLGWVEREYFNIFTHISGVFAGATLLVHIKYTRDKWMSSAYQLKHLMLCGCLVRKPPF